jgi:carboxypeptidase C (cathepsin A)
MKSWASLMLTVGAAFAAAQPAGFNEIKPVKDTRTALLASGPITYDLTAQQLPIRNENGDIEVRMFYVSYEKKGADPTKRPVMFCFNGGPGSATIWLHVGVLGPKRVPFADDGNSLQPPFQSVDNKESWIDIADIVAVDAPAAGFSRLASPSLGSRYFGVRQDIAAFTNFVREWLTEHNRWRSPIFIAGESYGGIRGSGLVGSLYNAGIPVNGFISISGTSNYQTLRSARGNDLFYTSFIPTMATTAWYHKKLGPRFRTVEQVRDEVIAFVEGDYLIALNKGDALPMAEQEKVAAKLSEFLGVSKEYCLASNLRPSLGAYYRELLKDDRLQFGRLDSRIVGLVETGVGGGGPGGGDPSDQAMTPAYVAVANDYLRRELGIDTDMPYLTYGNVRPWEEPEGSYAETATDLRNALERNKYLRVLYCMGYYDLACPYYATIFTVNHMGLTPATRSQIEYTYYPAGHMMYNERFSRIKMHADVKKFVEDSLAPR